jgi:hypothetical protein
VKAKSIASVRCRAKRRGVERGEGDGGSDDGYDEKQHTPCYLGTSLCGVEMDMTVLGVSSDK